MWETHGVQDPLRFLRFCLSLLPVPGLQQAGAALDRHYSDKAFEAEVKTMVLRRFHFEFSFTPAEFSFTN
jgi:hypothetical protein